MDAERRSRLIRAYVIAALVLIVVALAGVRHAVRRSNLVGRIQSPAAIQVLEPIDGSVTGERLRARFAVTGARVANPSRTHIVADEGHFHLTLDGRALEMQYTSDFDLRVRKGRHVLRVEFVANDHRPFNPRVRTSVRFEAK
jgi:hypothetical protein